MNVDNVNVSGVAQVVVACVAVGGGVWKWVVSWWKRPILSLRECDIYDFHMPSKEYPKASGEAKATNREFLVPIDNTGRSVASRCEVRTDCVLKKGNDGDSWCKLYFGMPIQLKWHPNLVSQDIPGKASSFLRGLVFTDRQQGENTTGAESENVKRCSLLYVGDDETLSRLPVSIGQPFTVLIRVCVRAHNTTKENPQWLFAHWGGGAEISKENFKMRIAQPSEVRAAVDVYDNLRKEGGVS